MKKTNLLLLLMLILQATTIGYGQATWNGSVSSDYNNASNWTWISGAGVPNSTTNISIPYMAINPLIINGNQNVACNDITFITASESDTTISNPLFLSVLDSASFTINGDITKELSTSEFAFAAIINLSLNEDLEVVDIHPKAKVVLGQAENQSINGVEVYAGKISIGNYDINIENASFYITDSLTLNAMPVTSGLSVSGNIELKDNAFLYVNPKRIKLPTFSLSQTPPHVITKYNSESPESSSMVANLVPGISGGEVEFITDTGTFVFPVGVSNKSFNPISTYSTSLMTFTAASALGPIESSCASEGFIDSSLKVEYIVIQTALDGSGSVSPINVSISYNDNPGLDIKGVNYNPTTVDGITLVNVGEINDTYPPCYIGYGVDTITTVGDYKTVSLIANTTYHKFILSSANLSELSIDSFVVSELETTTLTDPTYEYPFLGTYYPTGITSDITWSIVPVTGAAIVAPFGANALVTPVSSGTVWLKGTPVSYSSYADSILLNISLPVDSPTAITVTTTTGATTGAITTPSGTLALTATVSPTGAPSEVTWSIASGSTLATISSTGVVTAMGDGTAVARATSVSVPAVYGEITINISNQATSINNGSIADGMKVYPNPASDAITITYDRAHPKMSLHVYDVYGKVIHVQEVEANSLVNGTKIATSKWSAGQYFLKLEGNGNTYTRKITKK